MNIEIKKYLDGYVIKKDGLFYRRDGIGYSWWINIGRATIMSEEKALKILNSIKEKYYA
jgi:hypothetical protein